MKSRFKKQRRARHFLSPGYLKPYLDDFISELSKRGYTKLTINCYCNSVSHFANWLQKKNISLENITHETISNFAKHRCCCPGSRRESKVSCKYVDRVQRFFVYLSQQGIILSELNSPKKLLSPHLESFKKSLRCRGLASKTIIHYEYFINTLLPLLGDDPKKYNPAHVRQVICDASKLKSRCAIKKLTTDVSTLFRTKNCS